MQVQHTYPGYDSCVHIACFLRMIRSRPPKLLSFFLPHQGLRLNRTLVFLSLLNNQIGDYGATRLAEVCFIIKSSSLVLLAVLSAIDFSSKSPLKEGFCTINTEINLCKASCLALCLQLSKMGNNF